MVDPEFPPKAFSLKTFCKKYGPGDTYARAEIKAGRLKAQRLGNKLIITHLNAEEWLARLPSASPQNLVSTSEGASRAA